MKKQNYSYEDFKQLNKSQVREGFIRFISNQKQVDKYCLAYFCRMIDHKKFIYADSMKRAELLFALCEMANDDNKLFKCIQSEYTKSAILRAYNKGNK